MVDDMKKQMRGFEHLIGFTGKLDVTSRESMEELIKALDSKYKRDVQNSIRLHRLEFLHDLVQSKDRPSEDTSGTQDERETEREIEESKKPLEGTATREKANKYYEVITVPAKDIDDWKNQMTLSKIYYVLEHPRSMGLTWKRRVTKKKELLNFGDRDLIEWRASQNMRLRGFEEWAQRRRDARGLAERSGFDTDDLEDDEDSRRLKALERELEELIFDPSRRPDSAVEKRPAATSRKPSADRPFRFQDETVEDWTESYSDDSEYSGADDFAEEIEDSPDEVVSSAEAAKPESVAEDAPDLFSGRPEFSRYRNPIFEEMDKAQTFQEWYELYEKIRVVPSEEEEPPGEAKLDAIAEDAEEPPGEAKLDAVAEDAEEKEPPGEAKLGAVAEDAEEEEPPGEAKLGAVAEDAEEEPGEDLYEERGVVDSEEPSDSAGGASTEDETDADATERLETDRDDEKNLTDPGQEHEQSTAD